MTMNNQHTNSMPGQHEEIHIANEQLLPEVIRLLEEGHTVTIRLRGFSMRPFLEDNRDTALLTQVKELRVNDPVLAEVMPRKYVLHRIISINRGRVILRGDGNLTTEECLVSDIKGAVIGFYRKGRSKIDYVDGYKWRVYSWCWTRLYPLRRYLLFALHPHIPARFKKTKNNNTK